MMHWMRKTYSVGCAAPVRPTADRRPRLRSRPTGVWLTSLSFGLALMMACSFPRPEAGSPDGSEGGACKVDADCTSPTAVCDSDGSNTRVQYTQIESQLARVTPVCCDQNSCRAWSAHADSRATGDRRQRRRYGGGRAQMRCSPVMSSENTQRLSGETESLVTAT
jgi:hypothetical protein